MKKRQYKKVVKRRIESDISRADAALRSKDMSLIMTHPFVRPFIGARMVEDRKVAEAIERIGVR